MIKTTGTWKDFQSICPSTALQHNHLENCFLGVGWVVMKLLQVPPDIFHTAGKSHLLLSLLGFPVPPPNPGRATDVSVHAIPSRIKGVTMRQSRNQTHHTTKCQHTLFASNRTGKSPLESHRALGCTVANCIPYSSTAGTRAWALPRYPTTGPVETATAYHNFKTRAGSSHCFSMTCPGSGTCMTCTACQCIF